MCMWRWGRGGGASSARGGLTLRRHREISASTAAKRGALLRGKFPLLWGTMRSTSGARSPPSHTLEQQPLWGDRVGACQGPTSPWRQPSREGQPPPLPPGQRGTSMPSFPCLYLPLEVRGRGCGKSDPRGEVGVRGLSHTRFLCEFQTAQTRDHQLPTPTETISRRPYTPPRGGSREDPR